MPNFKLNGLPLSQTHKERLIKLLQSLPFGELLGRAEVARRLSISEYDKSLITLPPEFSHLLGPARRVWGSAKTIKALKKELAK